MRLTDKFHNIRLLRFRRTEFVTSSQHFPLTDLPWGKFLQSMRVIKCSSQADKMLESWNEPAVPCWPPVSSTARAGLCQCSGGAGGCRLYVGRPAAESCAVQQHHSVLPPPAPARPRPGRLEACLQCSPAPLTTSQAQPSRSPGSPPHGFSAQLCNLYL